MRKIYIDTSALNRIFDDQTQLKIYLESSAMIIIFELIEVGYVKIVSSEVLKFENSRNPYVERRIFVDSVLSKAIEYQKIIEDVLNRAKEIEKLSIKSLDALHLACAEKGKVDCFITCDERIIKKYKGQLVVMNPVDYIRKILQ